MLHATLPALLQNVNRAKQRLIFIVYTYAIIVRLTMIDNGRYYDVHSSNFESQGFVFLSSLAQNYQLKV